MNIKDFIPIGIVKVFWDYDQVEGNIKDAYYKLPISLGICNSYGQQYCNRFVFLDNNISETVESKTLTFEELGYSDETQLYETKILGNKIYLNESQCNDIKTIIKELSFSNENIKI